MPTLQVSTVYSSEYYPFPTAAKFFPSGYTGNLVFPTGAELDRTGNLLRLVWKHKTYTLGVTQRGIVAGFLGKLSPTKPAAICVILFSPSEARIFDARFTPEEEIDDCLERASQETPKKAAPVLIGSNVPALHQNAYSLPLGSGASPQATAPSGWGIYS